MPLPPVPATGTPALDEFLKAVADALQHDIYAPLDANGGPGLNQAAVDSTVQASQAPLQAQIDTALGGTCPIGLIVPYGGSTAPTGWLLCNGQSLAKAEYPALSEVIDGAFGQDDTHFSLPDLRGRVARGADGDQGVAGGADTVTLPVPSHVHQYLLADAATAVAEGNAVTTPISVLVPPVTQTPTDTDPNVGADDTIVVTNPYVALNYLIRAV